MHSCQGVCVRACHTPPGLVRKHKELRGSYEPKPLLGLLWEGMGEARYLLNTLNTFRIGENLNNFSRLWAIEVISSCPVLDPWVY